MYESTTATAPPPRPLRPGTPITDEPDGMYDGTSTVKMKEKSLDAFTIGDDIVNDGGIVIGSATRPEIRSGMRRRKKWSVDDYIIRELSKIQTSNGVSKDDLSRKGTGGSDGRENLARRGWEIVRGGEGIRT